MFPIRVLHILHSMNRGGAENSIMNYYRHIDREKVQFDFLLTEQNECQFEKEIIDLGGRIYRVPRLIKNKPFPYLSSVRSFLKHHPEYKVVHSHTSSKSFFPLMIAMSLGIPIRIAHCHGTRSKADSKINGFIRNSLRVPLKLVSTHYFACGEEAAKWLFGDRMLRSGKVYIMPNVIDCEKFDFNINKRKSFRSIIGVDKNTLVLGTTARFSVIKNHPFLVELLNSLQKIISEVRLLLVGDGHLKERIKALVHENGLDDKVIFAGVVENVNDYLQAMDFFIMPSFYEGLPLSLIEAQVSGLRCFVSDGVPKEADITGLVSFLPLDRGPEYWADVIYKAIGYERSSHEEVIKKAGYDASESAYKLQDFYIKAYLDKCDY